MRLGTWLIASLLLVASTVSAEPIVVGDGLWQDLNLNHLSEIQQSGDAGAMQLSFDYDWADQTIHDGHVTFFGFTEGTIQLRRSLQSRLDTGLQSMGLFVALYPAAASAAELLDLGPDVPRTVFGITGFTGQSYRPGDSFTLHSDSTNVWGDQIWRAAIHFAGAVANDQSGIGHGTITVTRVPEPSSVLLLSVGVMALLTRRRNGRAKL